VVYSPPLSHHDESGVRGGQLFMKENVTMRLEKARHTADYSDEMMRVALHINVPNYAGAVVTTKQVVDSISSL
jgi:uncharacterized protein (UPF0261 family)